MKKFMSEFKEFISRGSVVDMAVGIMILPAAAAGGREPSTLAEALLLSIDPDSNAGRLKLPPGQEPTEPQLEQAEREAMVVWAAMVRRRAQGVQAEQAALLATALSQALPVC